MDDGRDIWIVDAFTRQPFRGNRAGVVFDADGLSEDRMQAIAAEVGASETAFLLAPTGDDHDVWIRFFTPTVEVPSCGHATIAAHYARAVRLRLDPGRVMHRIGIGVLPVDLERHADDYRVTMTQGTPVFGDRLEGEVADLLLAALGIGSADLDPRGPLEWVDTGNSKVVVPLKRRATLDALRPAADGLLAVHQRVPSGGVFVFSLEGADEQALTRARMFAPQIGIPEDPVTGNGHGPLGSYLVRHGLAEHDGRTLQFRGIQGEAMGRPGYVDVTVAIEGATPTRVAVTGDAVVAIEGRLTARV